MKNLLAIVSRTIGTSVFIAAILSTVGCQKKSSEEGGGVKKAPHVNLRVEFEDLQKLLGNKKVHILDVRSREDYDNGHIPGAVRVDLAAWHGQALKEDGDGLKDVEAWTGLVRDLGLNDLEGVVVYSDSPTSATRIWWILKYLGAEQAGILDGGWKHWKEKDGKTSTEPAKPGKGNFTVEFEISRLAVMDELKKNIAAKTVQVIDARSDNEYQNGYIPGAIHLEWKELLTEDERFKPDGELQKIFEARGIDESKPSVSYCQTGGRASLNAYALELAGYKNARNYYSSWAQWGDDKSAPRETPKKK